MSMKLYKYQQEVVDICPNYKGLWLECGLGKTAISTRKMNTLEPIVKSVLVVCPKLLKGNWLKELGMWDLGDQEWKIISKEEVKKAIKEKTLDAYDAVIVDECHYFAGYRSAMFKALKKYVWAVKPKSVLLLSGTPYLSTPYNVMCYEMLLGKKPSWSEYRETFFKEVRIWLKGGSRVVPEINPEKMPLLLERLKSIGISLKKEDCLDLPERIYKNEYFELTSDQKKRMAYEKEVYAGVTKNGLWYKKHQLNGCGVLDELKNPVFVKSNKADRILEYAANYNKFIIVCRYTHEINHLAERLKKNGYNVGVLNGATKEREELIELAEKSDDFILLINHDISEGYNLTSFSMMLFFSHSFKYKDFSQLHDRIHRIGQKKKCLYIELLQKDSIDEAVLESLKNKKDFSLEIYERERLPSNL